MVADPARLRTRLLAAGAMPGFTGMMIDTRYDRRSELTGRDEVLRLRRMVDERGGEELLLSWKGPTAVTADGHKQRRELEYELRPRRVPPDALFEALGYAPVQVIERYVEYYHLGEADARLEWYPRMDTLVEIEGDAAGIDAAVRASGIPRPAFTAEPLAAFVARYGAESGRSPALVIGELGGEPPSWSAR